MKTNLKNNDKIKLVIFDLDETFWNGTLSSENPIEIINSNISLVKELVDRGIMCSISSKNNFEQAKEILNNQGIWDLFIFPKINWEPKGPQIKELILDAQLRDENILFIDDNHLNLEEAKFYCPNIKVAFPNILNQLLFFDGLKGKDDKSHSRLKQYKILENKKIERSTYDDNIKFLESSNIHVDCKEINDDDLDRIIELILRTNQLNFTKKRINIDELKNILNNPNYDSKCVYVKDRFGDYGLIGFYTLDKINSELIHFVFSCRIMNLGIEQWVYAKLNFPKITVTEPISSTLNTNDCPYYINVTQKDVKAKTNNKNKIKVLLLGNCDIQALSHYVMGIYNNIDALFYIDVSKETHMQIRHDSIWKMKTAVETSKSDKEYLTSVHKWLDETSFNNRAIYDNYDILVFSVLNDYMVKKYKDVKTEIILTPTTSYETNIFTASIDLVQKEFEKHSIINFSEEDIKMYQQNLTELEYMSEKEFRNNLTWLVKTINKPIIFLNGPEIDHPQNIEGQKERFIQYNKVLDEFIKNNSNCYLLDVRKYINKLEDTTDIVTHYKRNTYLKLSEDLFKMINQMNNVGINLNKQKLKLLIKFLISLLKKILKKLFSITNKYNNNIKYKILTILFVELKFKKKNG